ncbi:GNAT family N-acetyltransferase [Sporosarcina saromensis]|uniref:GNAT family N-acetyltransferase n=1 Tax=Sporosarcina saromensis TaxID=359365 RepID=A0ABU4GBX5_9BACL|nr:GNAT family N-acetyltransferase [Sporosarcina saromensis]MDW0114470.1 GNAT family N-acetyltransferase [Sporosarcina saromensis]
MDLRICEVTAENWMQIASLSVNDNQKDFIESNLFSLAQSKFEPEWQSVGLYDGQKLVGYAMHGRDRVNGEVWLDRFMIDQSCQGQGYAKRFLMLLLEEMKRSYQPDVIFLSVSPENEKAKHVYEQLGFTLNGKIDDVGEFPCLIMELVIQRSTTT